MIDHLSGAHDDRAVSLVLAAQWLVSLPAKKRIDSKALAEALAIANLGLTKSPTRP